MSQYRCHECDQPTMVVDTRPYFEKLRRRRRCSHKHESKTIEISAEVPNQLDDLIDWVLTDTAGIDPDLVSYLKTKARNTLLGIKEEDE